MNTKEIEKLLDQYYEGLTTLDEERRLREYFLTEPVPPHLVVHAELFRAVSSSKEESLSDTDFERRFLDSISETKIVSHPASNRKLIYITSLAAGFLILAGTFFIFQREIFTSSSKFSDHEISAAYAETQKALLLLSGNFNTGLEQMEKLKSFDKGMAKVQKLRHFNDGVEQAGKLSEFYKYQTIHIKPNY